VPNLFMAGRCVSVTHEALGTIRVMRTTGMMGEIVGMAASVCKDYRTDPRGVYAEHLAQLKERMVKGVGKLPPVVNRAGPAPGRAPKLEPPAWLKTAGKNLARSAKVTVSSNYDASKYPPANANDGRIDLRKNELRWVSARSVPNHLELSWDAPQTIGAARIVTGYYRGGSVADPIGDFVLQAHDGSAWKDIAGAKAAGNTRIDWHARFEPVTTRRLRLLVTKAPMDTARIWEIELYK
jgi:hypothetical protein